MNFRTIMNDVPFRRAVWTQLQESRLSMRFAAYLQIV